MNLVEALAPPLGALLFFVIVVRAIVGADRAERSAAARYKATDASDVELRHPSSSPDE